MRIVCIAAGIFFSFSASAQVLGTESNQRLSFTGLAVEPTCMVGRTSRVTPEVVWGRFERRSYRACGATVAYNIQLGQSNWSVAPVIGVYSGGASYGSSEIIGDELRMDYSLEERYHLTAGLRVNGRISDRWSAYAGAGVTRSWMEENYIYSTPWTTGSFSNKLTGNGQYVEIGATYSIGQRSAIRAGVMHRRNDMGDNTVASLSASFRF